MALRWRVLLAMLGFELVSGFARAQPMPVSVPAAPVSPIVPLGRPLERGGASIQRFRRGGHVETLGIDRSGHGAVLCSWQIFIAMRQALDACATGGHAAIRSELDRSIAATNVFIVKNTPKPTTLAQVEAAVRSLNAQADAGYAKLSPEQRTRACATSWAMQSAARLSPQELRQQTAELLSVPRLPVMNPCL